MYVFFGLWNVFERLAVFPIHDADPQSGKNDIGEDDIRKAGVARGQWIAGVESCDRRLCNNMGWRCNISGRGDENGFGVGAGDDR